MNWTEHSITLCVCEFTFIQIIIINTIFARSWKSKQNIVNSIYKKLIKHDVQWNEQV